MDVSAPTPRPPAGPDAVFLFCDGACRGNPGRMGLAVLLRYGRAEKLIAEPCGNGTGNAAELAAIERGLREIRRRDIPVVIVSDSSYAISVLSGRVRAHANVEAVRRIAGLMAEFRDIRFRRIPRGVSVPENDEVDALAARAAARGFRVDELRAPSLTTQDT